MTVNHVHARTWAGYPAALGFEDAVEGVLPPNGFTFRELDFIINYAVEYRMGRDVEGDEE